MVLAPEHPLVAGLTAAERKDAVEDYIRSSRLKSDLERTDLAKEKTGVFTGGYAINPVNGEKMPVWISDYILISYGTGAIMAVPAHDQRDFEFAREFDLPIVQVVSRDGTEYPLAEADAEDGVAINSGQFDGLSTAEFKERIVGWLQERGLGSRTVNYLLPPALLGRADSADPLR